MKTGILIQARKGSSRLPNKMVLPFYQGKGILELLIEKLINNYSEIPIILATTTNEIDSELIEIADKYGILSFRGDEYNVLYRFIEASKLFHISNIVRVCADNPFLDIDHIRTLINYIETDKYDYVSYKLGDIPVIKTHLGLFTEAVKLSSLKKVKSFTNEAIYMEHVTNYIYEHTEEFNCKLIQLPFLIKSIYDIRLTLDTYNDFIMEKELYPILKNKTVNQLLNYLLDRQELLSQMVINQKNNKK